MSDAEIPLWLNKLKSPKKRTSSVVSKSDDFDDASFLNPSTFEEKSSSSCKKQAQNGFICVLGDRVCPWEMKKTKSPSFPILTFPGRVHYLTLEKKVDKWCRRIPKGTIVGFDTEWKATFQKGVPQNRTALIQLCFERKFKLVRFSDLFRFKERFLGLFVDSNLSMRHNGTSKIIFGRFDDLESGHRCRKRCQET